MINPHLNILVQLAKVDGQADESELLLIREIGSSNNISDEDIDDAIAKAETSDPIPDLSLLSKEEKLELMYNLVLVMKADGIVHKEEMKFCLAILRKLGFEDDALFELVSNTTVDEELHTDKTVLINKAKTFFKED
ncbi:MAG: hypothetical protein OEX02_16970 [Cyclobacteriaceae bacterium]|nr:hypothetical protein [Cyclobacteriaceae bacterium]